MLGNPLSGQFAQTETQALRGEIGAAGLFRHEETAQLHDELEPLGAGDRVPADDCVAILDVPGRSAPDEHCDHLAVFEHELAEAVARFAARAEEMLIIEHLMGDFPIRR